MKPLTEKEQAIAALVVEGFHGKRLLDELARRGHCMAEGTLRSRIIGIARKIPNPHDLSPIPAIKLWMRDRAA